VLRDIVTGSDLVNIGSSLLNCILWEICQLIQPRRVWSQSIALVISGQDRLVSQLAGDSQLI